MQTKKQVLSFFLLGSMPYASAVPSGITASTEENKILAEINVKGGLKAYADSTDTDPSCITIDALREKIANDEDVTSVNTGCLIDMSELFASNTNFNQDISDWNVSNVTNMNRMFTNTLAFNQAIGDWDVSNVTSMGWMFSSAAAFSDNDLSAWDVSNVNDHYRFLDGAGTGNTEPNWP